MGTIFRLKDRFRSFAYAWNGICSFISHEHNAWIHCAAIIVTTAAGFFFGISNSEWTIIVLCFGLVMAAEAMNSAIERLVDIMSPERNQKAKQVKDIAAGSVLICAITAAITGIIIFYPYIYAKLIIQ